MEKLVRICQQEMLKTFYQYMRRTYFSGVQSTIFFPFSANIYLFKVNRNSRKRCEICSKLTIKIQEQRHRRTFFTRFTSVNVSSVNFKDFE